MTASTQWQLARAAAERYQTVLTPVILGPFAEALVDFANLQPGETAVDVGCGTGAAARHAAGLVCENGQVTLDVTQLDLPMPTLKTFVPRHIGATPMGAGYSQATSDVQQAIVTEVCEKMAQFEVNGRIQIPFRSHMILCQK